MTQTAHPDQALSQPFVWVILWQEVLVRNTKLISHHQPEKSGKGLKETPHVQPPPRILLTGIHLGWAMSVPLGRTLSQNDGPKTTRKAIPSPWNSRLWAAWLSSSGFPYPMLTVSVPFPNKASCFFSSRVSSDNLFPSVRQEPTLRPWKGSPFLQQHCIPEVRIRSHKLRAQFHKTDPTSDSNCKSLIITWTSDPLSIWVGVP